MEVSHDTIIPLSAITNYFVGTPEARQNAPPAPSDSRPTTEKGEEAPPTELNTDDQAAVSPDGSYFSPEDPESSWQEEEDIGASPALGGQLRRSARQKKRKLGVPKTS